MARPRTFASPVAFRLPPPYQEKLEAKAIRAGLPLAVYVREVLIDILDNGYKKPTAKKTTATRTPKTEPAAKTTPVKKTTHRRTARST